VVVPTIWGGKCFSYLPLLAYTDKTRESCGNILSRINSSRYQIRLLNPEFNEFQNHDPVTMRLDLGKKDITEIWQHSLASTTRNQIRKAQKCGLDVHSGNNKILRDNFYDLYQQTMHRHGTPPLGYRFFEGLSANFKVTFYLVCKKKTPLSAMVIMSDRQLIWVGWTGGDIRYFKYCPNNLMYWEAIKDSFNKGMSIFDFGRSPFGGGTFQYKKHWGTVPVKIDIEGRRNPDIYKKYKIAASVWRRLPGKVTSWAGPRLCRYLVDL